MASEIVDGRSGSAFATPAAPLAIVVMGVSGSGKSTLGAALAQRLGYAFIEGDGLHPPANVAKMESGAPLGDDDRWPWLEKVAAALAAGAGRGGAVAACSALKRAYRAYLAERAGLAMAFVHPVLSRAALAPRMAQRTGHFMPASLLDSQLATLEPPDERAERAIAVDGALPVGAQVDLVVARLAGMAR